MTITLFSTAANILCLHFSEQIQICIIQYIYTIGIWKHASPYFIIVLATVGTTYQPASAHLWRGPCGWNHSNFMQKSYGYSDDVIPAQPLPDQCFDSTIWMWNELVPYIIFIIHNDLCFKHFWSNSVRFYRYSKLGVIFQGKMLGSIFNRNVACLPWLNFWKTLWLCKHTVDVRIWITWT